MSDREFMEHMTRRAGDLALAIVLVVVLGIAVVVA